MELESIEKLEELPLFPLTTVLFPGAILPLHIFEERYKSMIAFAIDHDNLFGLSYHAAAEVDKETLLELGSVGCLAKINAAMKLEEGRMNLIALGVIRYRVIELTQLVPFLLASVEPFQDDPDPESAVEELFEEIRGLCIQFLVETGIMDESRGRLQENLPDEPEAFSLLLASLVPIDVALKQELLEMTSTKKRLMRLKSHVTTAISDYGKNQLIQERAKGNGKGSLS